MCKVHIHSYIAICIYICGQIYIYICMNIPLSISRYIITTTGPLAERLECPSMARETGDQSYVESYQRLKKWYLIPPWQHSALSGIDQGYSETIRRKEWCPSLHLGVVAIEKGAFGSPSNMVANFTLYYYLQGLRITNTRIFTCLNYPPLHTHTHTHTRACLV